MEDKIINKIIDPELGEFSCTEINGKLYQWVKKALTVDGIEFTLCISNVKEIPVVDEVLRARVRMYIKEEPAIRKKVAEDTFSTAENWLDPEEFEGVLTKERYLSCLFPVFMDVEDPLVTCLFYEEDQDIFAGHSIMVDVDDKGNLLRADLAG